MVEVEIVGVRVELPSNTPIVLLRELEGDKRLLPILIGNAEATAIAFARDKVETPRPMTHDLMKNVLDDLKATLELVVVTELKERTFYADLHIRTDGQLHVVSSRPSDAIALAVRASTPIFVNEQVLDEAGYVEQEAEEADDVVEQFRQFIDSVNPEDFAS